MARYAIKHKKTGKFYYEDEGGVFLLDEDDAFITFGRKKDADEMLNDMIEYSDDGIIYTENGDFPIEEFEVAELLKKIKIMNTYTYFTKTTQEEIELTNSILKDINIDNKDELFNVTKEITSLTMNKQLQIFHCILDSMYSVFNSTSETIKNKNIESFLGQDDFKPCRSILLTIVDEDLSEKDRNEKIMNFEKEFDIKIDISKD